MDTSATLAADVVPVLIKEKLLSIADKDTVFYEIGDKEPLPEGQGKTIQFTRYERLALPAAPLTEGVTPNDTALSTSSVQAVVDQWGAVVTLTDVAILTVRHPVLRVAQQRLGTQHAETVDREVQRVLMGTSNVTFAGTATTRSALSPGDVITSDLVRKIMATLRSNGAPSWDGGMFLGVVDPFEEADLSKDPTFVNAASYSNIRALFTMEIGQWMGGRWKRSNLIPIITQLVSTTPPFAAAANVGAPAAGETNFAATSTVLVQVTQLDAATGFETGVSQVVSVTNAATFSVAVTIPAAMPTGTYNVYTSLENGAVATLQVQVAHVAGTANVFTFFKAGTPSAANRFVVQATGPVAPPAPPAGGQNVHIFYVFGREAFGVTDLGGLITTLTQPVASDSDPLKQRRKAGWSQLFKTVIKNVNFYARGEALSAFN